MHNISHTRNMLNITYGGVYNALSIFSY